MARGSHSSGGASHSSGSHSSSSGTHSSSGGGRSAPSSMPPVSLSPGAIRQYGQHMSGVGSQLSGLSGRVGSLSFGEHTFGAAGSMFSGHATEAVGHTEQSLSSASSSAHDASSLANRTAQNYENTEHDNTNRFQQIGGRSNQSLGAPGGSGRGGRGGGAGGAGRGGGRGGRGGRGGGPGGRPQRPARPQPGDMPVMPDHRIPSATYSSGPTANGTASYASHGGPTFSQGVPDHLLSNTSGQLAHDVHASPFPGPKPSMAGAFSNNGHLEVGTSMRPTQGNQANIHPSLQQWMDNHPNRFGETHHGNCAETNTMSNYLWSQDPHGHQTDQNWAQQQLDGGRMTSHWANPLPPQRPGQQQNQVGDYAAPCRHCNSLLSGLNVTPVQTPNHPHSIVGFGNYTGQE